jgi:uncharacterized protein (PEP-CTERM system associated)
MGTTRATSNNITQRIKLARPCWGWASFALIPWCCASLAAQAAESTFSPQLRVAGHGYQTKTGQQDWDKGASLELQPSLDYRYVGSWLRTDAQIEHAWYGYKDSQRDTSDFTSFTLRNSGSFWQKQLEINVGAARSYQSRDTRNSRFADAVTSADSMAKLDQKNADVRWQQRHIDWFNSTLTAGVSSVTTGAAPLLPGQAQNLTAFDNQTKQAGLELGSRSRSTQFFWQADGQYQNTARQDSADLRTRQGSFTLGSRLLDHLSVIGRGSYEQNGFALPPTPGEPLEFADSRSLGAGLEWQFDAYSYWNISSNKIRTPTTVDRYIATEFRLRPSIRTELSGQLDKRFFGRSAQLDLSYRLRHLRVNLNVSDDVNSLLGFAIGAQQVGNYVCPTGVNFDINQCFLLPSSNFSPTAGQQLLQVTFPGQASLSEAVVLRRGASVGVDYQFNRLSSSLQLSRMRDLYLEQNQLSYLQTLSLQLGWQLARRDRLSWNSSLSKQWNAISAGQTTNNAGDQWLHSLSWTHSLNRRLDLEASLRRVDADYTDAAFDYAENRLSLSALYRF